MFVLLRFIVLAIEPMLRNAVEVAHLLVEFKKLLKLLYFLSRYDDALGEDLHHGEFGEVVSDDLPEQGTDDRKTVFL